MNKRDVYRKEIEPLVAELYDKLNHHGISAFFEAALEVTDDGCRRVRFVNFCGEDSTPEYMKAFKIISDNPNAAIVLINALNEVIGDD